MTTAGGPSPRTEAERHFPPPARTSRQAPSNVWGVGYFDLLLDRPDHRRHEDAGQLEDLEVAARAGLVASLQDLPMLAEQGRLLALAAIDARSGQVVGGGTLHHFDSERKIVEIGYFVLPHARRRGIATTIARLLSEHAFSLGVERVAAYVNVGNVASERVVERAGFTREGVVRSMPKPDGRRIDKTYSHSFRANDQRGV
jgi:L-amino acid N-acyltransferase YncA